VQYTDAQQGAQVLEMDLAEQQRLGADASPRENGTLMNGEASTSGRSHAATAPAVDVFFEAEVMNRTEHNMQVTCMLRRAQFAPSQECYKVLESQRRMLLQVWLAISLPPRTLLSDWHRSARPPDDAKASVCRSSSSMCRMVTCCCHAGLWSLNSNPLSRCCEPATLGDK